MLAKRHLQRGIHIVGPQKDQKDTTAKQTSKMLQVNTMSTQHRNMKEWAQNMHEYWIMYGETLGSQASIIILLAKSMNVHRSSRDKMNHANYFPGLHGPAKVYRSDFFDIFVWNKTGGDRPSIQNRPQAIPIANTLPELWQNSQKLLGPWYLRWDTEASQNAVYNNNGLLHSKVILKMTCPSPPEAKERKIKQEPAISPGSLRSIAKTILWGLRQLASQHLLCLPDLKCTLACCSWTEKDWGIWSSKDSKVLCMPFRFFTK